MIAMLSERIVITTNALPETHAVRLQALVRVLGRALESENIGKDDQALMVNYCDLLEEMLPNMEQILPNPS